MLYVPLSEHATRDVSTWIPGSRVAYPGPDPGPAICPVTAIAFIKALTARVATYRRVLHWLQQKTRSGPCLLIIIEIGRAHV